MMRSALRGDPPVPLSIVYLQHHRLHLLLRTVGMYSDEHCLFHLLFFTMFTLTMKRWVAIPFHIMVLRGLRHMPSASSGSLDP